ncbi:MAG: cell division protein ZapE, partial [Alphaproteobacteria bacterium]
MTTPIETYRALVQEGTLKADPAQELAAEGLTLLHNRLRTVHRPTRESAGGLRGLFSRRSKSSETETRTDYQGLYMFGGVGRGKSMLMDMFFESAPVHPKRRIHFHEFMIEVHGLIHTWRHQSKAERTAKFGKSFAKEDDPIPAVAKHMADGAQLLCFDEFQVSDVADAMILSRLFTEMFDHGVWMVATSNRAPSDLYLGGLNRPLFEPFIDLVYQQLDVLHLESPNDYRLERLMGSPVYWCPLSKATTKELDLLWEDLAGHGANETRTLEVQGR